VQEAMSDRMIKRIALRLAEARDWNRRSGGPEWGDKEVVEFVIAAMRAPDKHMLRAAAKAMSPKHRPTQKYVSNARKHAIRYVAMIEAALPGQ
jgi:hypothetical protein